LEAGVEAGVDEEEAEAAEVAGAAAGAVDAVG